MFLAHGFQAFLSKPIDIIMLDATINTWVRNRELEHELELQKDHVPVSEPDPAGDALLDRLQQIDDFDAEVVYEKVGGLAESVLAILKSYVKNTPPLLDQLRTVNEESLPEYAIIVHGIKGSSRSIGAEDIGGEAEGLEFAAKKGDWAFIAENNESFLAKTEQLIGALAAALEEIGENRERRPAPDPQLLQALSTAAAAFDVDAAEEAIVRLEAFDYEEGGDLVEWLREQLDVGGFKNISERLSEDAKSEN
jgi:HPt (histidine-containing phosphotransfer) domain-containing protein